MAQVIVPTTHRFPTLDKEKPVSFSLGTQRRIIDRFKMHWPEVLRVYGRIALPELLYCAMYDAAGNPPDFPVSAVTEVLYSTEELREMEVAWIAATSNGRQEKKEIAAMIEAVERGIAAASSPMKTNGLASGHTPTSISESAAPPSPAGNTPATSGS